MYGPGVGLSVGVAEGGWGVWVGVREGVTEGGIVAVGGTVEVGGTVGSSRGASAVWEANIFAAISVARISRPACAGVHAVAIKARYKQAANQFLREFIFHLERTFL